MKIRKQNCRPMTMSKILNVFVSVSILLLMQSSVYALTVQVDPQDISIGIGYHGSRLRISGDHAPGEQVIVRISSEIGETRLKYKGKAGGALWMKMGDMTFKSVPTLYIIRSPEPLSRLLSDTELAKFNLGYDALAANITIESEKKDLDKSLWLSEFFKFKEDDNLYQVDEGMVPVQSSGDSNSYQYELELPYQAPPGTYRLEAYAVKDQHVVAQSFRDISVQRSGIVSFLSELAFNNAATYGLIAILIAALAGFSVGFVFKGGGAH